MSDLTKTHPADGTPHDPELEVEVLITRLVDGEATDEDRQRFDHLAASEPTLWRQRALRQEDMTILAEQVRDATATMERVALPRRRFIPTRLSLPMAFSGWAAVLIIAVTWVVLTSLNRSGEVRNLDMATSMAPSLSPEDHFEKYLSAPYVLGDMQPLVVEVKELPDGRIAVHFVRRIEEIAFLDPSAELPVDDEGELTSDPTTLRRSEPAVGWPNVD